MISLKKMLPLTLIAVLGSQLAFALNPSRTYKQLPDKFNMKYEAHDVKTKDGEAQLKAWYFPASAKTTNLVLICHNGEGNMADYLKRVDMLTSTGYNVVTFDYRGYGESSAFEIDNNMYIYPHFQNDVESMIDFCRKKYVSSFNIYGWGIGAGLGMGIGWHRKEIKAIVADTPFLSMEDLEERFEDWDTPMEVPFAGYEKRYEPINAVYQTPKEISAGSKKVKLIIGSNDILFKADDMKKIQAKRKLVIDKEIYVVENPDRKDNFSINKNAYMKQVTAAFK